MKCSMMLHFIWVFTVCKSTHLGVSPIQRVNYIYIFLVEICRLFELQNIDCIKTTSVYHFCKNAANMIEKFQHLMRIIDANVTLEFIIQHLKPNNRTKLP